MELNAVKFGLAGGIVAGLCVFITTLMTAIFGWFPMYTSIVIDLYGMLGYKASFLGAILGAIYAFVDGFIFVGVFAWIYNKLV